MIWRIGQFPELDHLSAAQRRVVLRCVRWWVYPVMVARSLVIGVIAFLILGFGWAMVFYWAPLSSVLGIGFVAATAVTYLYQIGSLRLAMREEIRRLVAGQSAPMCLRCGYDLRGSDGERCPECDAPIRLAVDVEDAPSC